MAALGSADLGGVGACFSRGACLLNRDSTAVYGREAICSLLGQIILAGTRVETGPGAALRAGGLVVDRRRWTLCTPTPTGTLEHSQEGIAISQRVEERWKLALLAPWGLGPAT